MVLGIGQSSENVFLSENTIVLNDRAALENSDKLRAIGALRGWGALWFPREDVIGLFE